MMAHVLKSLLTEKTLWKLLSETALAVFAVFLIYRFGFHPLAVVVGTLIFVVIYFREIEERRFLKISFLLLPLLFLAAAGFINPLTPGLAALVLVFAVLFFVMLGLVNLFFKERFLVYSVFNTAFLISLLLFFFYLARGPENFWILGVILFFSVFLILRESFVFFGLPGGRRTTLYSGILSFISLEFFYVLQFLPLGFVNAAAFLAIFLILGKDIVVSSAKGNLNFSFAMRQTTFFAVLTIAIFAASRW